jgi:hypothetical protein
MKFIFWGIWIFKFRILILICNKLQRKVMWLIQVRHWKLLIPWDTRPSNSRRLQILWQNRHSQHPIIQQGCLYQLFFMSHIIRKRRVFLRFSLIRQFSREQFSRIHPIQHWVRRLCRYMRRRQHFHQQSLDLMNQQPSFWVLRMLFQSIQQFLSQRNSSQWLIQWGL